MFEAVTSQCHGPRDDDDDVGPSSVDDLQVFEGPQTFGKAAALSGKAVRGGTCENVKFII
jgi:hypothetical protein